MDLSDVDFERIDLRGTNLSQSKLIEARLTDAYLQGANLSGADLTGAELSFAWLGEAKAEDVFGVGGEHLNSLNSATLEGAKLNGATFESTRLNGVNLKGANLRRAFFRYANLSNANLTNATLESTTFVECDLSTVIGLDTIKHLAPSSIGIDTIYRSQGNIPEVFLRGAGVPENFVTYVSSLTGRAFEFYSCFISYASKDHEFAERLHADLQNRSVRCWFAPEDLKIGERIRIGIDQSIKKHDKLLLVLSQDSVESEWVEQEVETALSRERSEKRLVLFPIRLDDSVMKVDTGWPALIRNTRNIGDFRNWKDHDIYLRSFGRLLRDLKADESQQSS